MILVATVMMNFFLFAGCQLWTMLCDLITAMYSGRCKSNIKITIEYSFQFGDFFQSIKKHAVGLRNLGLAILLLVS